MKIHMKIVTPLVLSLGLGTGSVAHAACEMDTWTLASQLVSIVPLGGVAGPIGGVLGSIAALQGQDIECITEIAKEQAEIAVDIGFIAQMSAEADDIIDQAANLQEVYGLELEPDTWSDDDRDFLTSRLADMWSEASISEADAENRSYGVIPAVVVLGGIKMSTLSLLQSILAPESSAWLTTQLDRIDEAEQTLGLLTDKANELENALSQNIKVHARSETYGVCGLVSCPMRHWYEVTKNGSVVYATGKVSCGSTVSTNCNLSSQQAQANDRANTERNKVRDAFLTDEYYEVLDALNDHINAN